MTEFIPIRFKYTDSGLASGIQELEPGETIDSGYFVVTVSGDHSGLNLLSANDHPQYLLSATYALSSGSFQDATQAVFDNSAAWGAGGGITDHSGLSLLSANDHPQYVLSATNAALSSLVAALETSTLQYVLSSTNSTLSSTVDTHITSATAHQPAAYFFTDTSATITNTGTGFEQVDVFNSLTTVSGMAGQSWGVHPDGDRIQLPGAGTYMMHAKIGTDKSDSGLGDVALQFTEYVLSHSVIASSQGKGANRGNADGGCSTFVLWQTSDSTPEVGLQFRVSSTSITSSTRNCSVMITKLSDETS